MILKRIHNNPVFANAKIVKYEIVEYGYKEPKLSFFTKDGIEICEKPAFYFATDLSKIRTYRNKINQTVEVTYNQNNPREFIISSENKLNYLVLSFLCMIALIFICVSISSLLGIIEVNY
ncbi:hypothetical protein [Moheibacter stercoris]|uniref:DUF3592 domain-containing protein n=1 Tax=Moheibacter stercoris TaxID=1628251 RepID=A0ABV2LWR3_9FLAO